MRLATLVVCGTLIQACSPRQHAFVAPPSISSFTSSASWIFLGENASLSAVFSDGEGVIDPDVGAVTSGNAYAISPREDTTYTLAVTNAAGVVASAQLRIQVDSAPVAITSFTNSPEPANYGETTTLSWTITGVATALALDGVSVLGRSSYTVSPVRRETHLLAGSNPLGGESRRLTVAARGVDLVAGSLGGPGNLDGTGRTARFNRASGVAIDRFGNLYVADSGNSTIRKISPEGRVSTLAGLAGVPGSADGTVGEARFNNPGGVAVDGSGNVFVVDTSNDTIRKIAPDGAVTTVAGRAGSDGSADGPGADARFSLPKGVAVDGSGNIYVADYLNSTIRRITPDGVVSTWAGRAHYDGRADGPGPNARFYHPQGVAVDDDGNVYVADSGNDTIRKITSEAMVSTVAGTAGSSGSADGVGSDARFRSPAGVAVDHDGNVYVADFFNYTIREISPEGVVTTIAGNPEHSGSIDGLGRDARFSLPTGVAVDVAGVIYVADNFNSTIRKISAAREVTTFAGEAGGDSGSTDGPAGGARFRAPDGVAVDRSGNIYVADSENCTIRQITPAGAVSTVAGVIGRQGFRDGMGSLAEFDLPHGLAVDSAGNVYVAGYHNHAIRKVSPAGLVSTLAGRPGIIGGSSDGIGPDALFNLPQGVAVDASGYAYVADSLNYTIRKISPTGVVTTLAGLAGHAGSDDGIGREARFALPQGVAADDSGNVYVADTRNHTIRKITSDGRVTTLAGLAGAAGNTDGAGTAARFNLPHSLAADNSGNVYVADTGNDIIRKVTSAGVVTTIAGRRFARGILPGPLPASLSAPLGVALTPAGDLIVTTMNSVLQITAF